MDVVLQFDVYEDSTAPSATAGIDVERLIETMRDEKYADDPAIQQMNRELLESMGIDPDEPAGPEHEPAPQSN